MNLAGIIILSAIGVFAVIGLIVGAVKGFSRAKSWAVELVLTGLISISVSGLIGKNVSGTAAGIITLGITVALIIVFIVIFALLSKLISRKIEQRKQLSYYEQYDEREDNTEQILSAIGTEDTSTYNELAKRKFKEKGGAWSIVDRILGAFVLAVKAVVIVGFISCILLTVLDFTRLASVGGKLYSSIGSIYENSIWKFFKNYIFDFLIIGILTMCIKSGFSGGLFSALWPVMVLGLLAGAGVLSWYFAFRVDEFASVSQSLAGKLEGSMSSFSSVTGISVLSIAKAIVAAILFVFMLIAVILIAIFVPKLIDRARDGAIFCTIDGVLGAVVLTAFISAILLVVGAVANSISELEFMNVFNAYFEKSKIATYFYNNNLLNAMGILNNLPIKGWLS